MAKILTEDVINRIHASLDEHEYVPFIYNNLSEVIPYFQGGDYVAFLSTGCFDNSKEALNARFVMCCLILAAEEELSDYPMEAVGDAE